MTKKSAAGTRRPNAPKGDCWLESEAWASRASIGVGPSSTGTRVGLVRTGSEAFERLLDVFRGGSGLDRVAQTAHEVEIKREVMEGIQAEGEQLLRGEQVT